MHGLGMPEEAPIIQIQSTRTEAEFCTMLPEWTDKMEPNTALGVLASSYGNQQFR